MSALQALYRNRLPSLNDRQLLTDGGLETTLVFQQDWELPEFAAFVLLESSSGRKALTRYYQGYVSIAQAHNVGIILETPTWRASQDWGDKLGYCASSLHQLNLQAVAMLADLRRNGQHDVSPLLISGCLGPQSDGYQPETFLSTTQACEYHQAQVNSFATSPADLVCAMTMTYVEEAIGITAAAANADMPCVISFTVETDGRLPSGMPLGEAIEQVDAASAQPPWYFMVNCAHPTHFINQLARAKPWLHRIGGIRANASQLSHAELDAATELDEGDCLELSNQYKQLQRCLPKLRVLGGCCGTDHRHIAAIASRCLA